MLEYTENLEEVIKLKKICIVAAIFMMTLAFAVQNAYAQEVEVYHNSDTRTTYYVEDSSIAYDNSDIAFKVKVMVYEKTYRSRRKTPPFRAGDVRRNFC